jgi:hypothetical protein
MKLIVIMRRDANGSRPVAVVTTQSQADDVLAMLNLTIPAGVELYASLTPMLRSAVIQRRSPRRKH